VENPIRRSFVDRDPKKREAIGLERTRFQFTSEEFGALKHTFEVMEKDSHSITVLEDFFSAFALMDLGHARQFEFVWCSHEDANVSDRPRAS
jgi:hypothetical protein